MLLDREGGEKGGREDEGRREGNVLKLIESDIGPSGFSAFFLLSFCLF